MLLLENKANYICCKAIKTIKLLAQAKLASIIDAILQAIQDEKILPAKFYKIPQEIEKYRKRKEEI